MLLFGACTSRVLVGGGGGGGGAPTGKTSGGEAEVKSAELAGASSILMTARVNV